MAHDQAINSEVVAQPIWPFHIRDLFMTKALQTAPGPETQPGMFDCIAKQVDDKYECQQAQCYCLRMGLDRLGELTYIHISICGPGLSLPRLDKKDEPAWAL